MSTRKERSSEEVAAEFASASSVMNPHVAPPDDTPEPDYAREAGLTHQGTVDPDYPAATPATADSPASPAPTMENIMLMLVKALEGISAGQANAQQVAMQALTNAQNQLQPDNKHAPGISDLNPQGELQYPRPKLKCEMFIPWEAEQESLTWEEIELLNLLESGEFVVKRNDGVKIMVSVQMLMNLNGKPNRVLMNSETAFNDEHHWMMPPLTTILRQVLHSRPHTREAAEKVLTMDERLEKVSRGELAVSFGMR